MQVFHQPVEDCDVAVDGNVYIVESLLLREILLKVFHVSEEESFIAFEVLCLLLGLVAHMNQDLVCPAGCRWSGISWLWCRATSNSFLIY